MSLSSAKKTIPNILVFVAPALLILVVFGVVPIIYNFVMSLHRTDLISPGEFVGFDNYEALFKDPIFRKALRNNIFLVIGSLIAHLFLGLYLANTLFMKFKNSNFFQSVYFMPSVVTGVAVGLTWTFMFSPRFGLVNAILDLLHLAQFQRQWLSDESTAMLAIIIAVMWQFVGYHVVIQLAAMKSIPTELYEAARIDGASSWHQFRYVTFPLIKPVLAVDAILIVTGSLKYYDLVFVMTGGGPNHSTEVLSTYIFEQGFRVLRYGYASAIANVLLLLCAFAVIMSKIVFKSEDYTL